jgi:hypothetical protein
MNRESKAKPSHAAMGLPRKRERSAGGWPGARLYYLGFALVFLLVPDGRSLLCTQVVGFIRLSGVARLCSKYRWGIQVTRTD